MEWIYLFLDQWAARYMEWRKGQAPETAYVSMSSRGAVMVKDARGKLLMSYRENGELCVINHDLGIKTVMRQTTCEKR